MPRTTNNAHNAPGTSSGSVDDRTLRGALASVRRRAQRLADRRGCLLRFMEVCGTHTVALSRTGLRGALADVLQFVSGPGCPVCVTPGPELSTLQRYAALPDTVLATFGDMLRVPDDRGQSLADISSRGGHVQVVMSALKAVELAADQPDIRVVFAAVGFETTAPATALAIVEAQSRGLNNFFCHVSHKLTPPAVFALLDGASSPALDGFLCPGHVSTITGSEVWRPLAERYGYPSVVGGFDAEDLLVALNSLLDLCENNTADLVNAYPRVVRPEGNRTALALLEQVFHVSEASWRGLGTVSDSGLRLRSEFERFDARQLLKTDDRSGGSQQFGTSERSEQSRTQADEVADQELAARLTRACRCAEVLTGQLIPPACPLFGKRCTPSTPVGPCMVSTEGSCAAYYLYS